MTTISCRSTQDIVNFAIEKEENAMDFYARCAKRAINPGIKEFFTEMVEEETRHRDLLKNLDPSGSELAGYKLQKIENLMISDYLIDIKFKDDLTYQDALTIAMKKEEKAHEFYAGWKGRCMHEGTAKLFGMLENEELKHKRRLETLYDDEILRWD